MKRLEGYLFLYKMVSVGVAWKDWFLYTVGRRMRDLQGVNWMKIRMCPYCDHEMDRKRKHRCSVCGAFVWKAWEQDAPHDLAHHQEPETRKTSSAKTMVKITAAVIAAALLILGGIKLKENSLEVNTFISSIFDNETDIAGNYGKDILDQDEILAEGRHCNGYGHMDVKKDDLVGKITAFLETKDMAYDLEDRILDPASYEYGNGENKSLNTYYSGEVFINIDSDVFHSVFVDYDSVTREVHEISLSFEGGIKGAQMMLVQCMNWLEDGFGDQHSDDLKHCFEMEDDFSFSYIGSYEVYLSQSEYAENTAYYLNITGNDEVH